MAGFPSTLNYELKKNAVASKMNTQVHFPITSSNGVPNDMLTIPLATGRYGSYLDPTSIYLSYILTNLDVSNCVIDHSGYSVIDRLAIVSSGQTASDLQFYAPWAAMILDSQIGMGKSGFMSAFAGCDQDNNLNVNRQGLQVNAATSVNISLPLMGTCIDSSSSDKLIPVGKISDLQVIIYVASAANAVTVVDAAGAAATTAAGTANWKLSNISLTCTYVTLDAGAQKMLDDTGDILQWSAELWKGFNYTVGTASQDAVICTIKCSSLKSLYSIYRNAANINNKNALTNSSRVNPYLNGSSFFLTVGAETIPGIPLKNSAMHAVEYLKSWHGLGATQALHTQFDGVNWIAADTTNPATCGSFVQGINLESYSNKSNTIHSGCPVLGSTALVLNQTYSTNAFASCTGVVENIYTHFDAIISVSDGVLSVSF